MLLMVVPPGTGICFHGTDPKGPKGGWERTELMALVGKLARLLEPRTWKAVLRPSVPEKGNRLCAQSSQQARKYAQGDPWVCEPGEAAQTSPGLSAS